MCDAKKYLLIDGKNLLFRAGFANANLRTSDGRYSGAIHGFIKMLHRLRIQFPDAEFVVLWEQAGQKTYRHRLFPGYKDRSKSNPESSVSRGIQEQIEGLKTFAFAIGLRWAELAGIEADDLAGLAATFLTKAFDVEVVLHSGDRDWWQLAAMRGVSVLSEQGVQAEDIPFVTDERVHESFGCRAKELIRLRPFVGDTSDKIPPIKPRFMKRHALELVRHGADPRIPWADQPQFVRDWPGLAELWPNYVRNYKLMCIARNFTLDLQAANNAPEILMQALMHDPPERNYKSMTKVFAHWELQQCMDMRTFLFALAQRQN